ncbi:MAG: glucosaminidase domain-containing protein [Chloroflexaceae bacterium]|nr:glucosaminidase domain-containing protein [Chloroflexaceae bacterium]
MTYITLDAPLLASPRGSASAAITFITSRPTGEYTFSDVALIVNDYWRVCQRIRLDPLVVMAQVVLETGNLTSWWAARPRRNPAGLGVTGIPGEGLSFASWERGCRAHTGRLLAYALTDAQTNGDQWAMVNAALYLRPLPERLRGVAPTLRGLAGTWAVDPWYAHKVAQVANSMLG